MLLWIINNGLLMSDYFYQFIFSCFFLSIISPENHNNSKILRKRGGYGENILNHYGPSRGLEVIRKKCSDQGRDLLPFTLVVTCIVLI